MITTRIGARFSQEINCIISNCFTRDPQNQNELFLDKMRQTFLIYLQPNYHPKMSVVLAVTFSIYAALKTSSYWKLPSRGHAANVPRSSRVSNSAVMTMLAKLLTCSFGPG